jgi:hypothetical protein
MLRTAALATMALLAASAVSARKQGVPVATPAGKPQSCIPLAQIRETRVRDDRTIDFIMSGRRAYRNVLPNSCPQLGFEEAFSYSTSLSQLCSSDIITVLQKSTPLMRGASCGLGQFQPVTGIR